MFVYYYIHVERPFEEVEPALLRMIPGLRGWAEDAYRDGEHLHTRVGTRGGILAKSVEVTAGSPVRGASETWIPIRWEATGAPSLFPSLEADVVAAYVGASLTQIALRGTYQAPFGRVGEALDRALLHRIAEASVKAFVDRIAESIGSDLLPRVTEGRAR
ncbi:MAG: hypothetical protein E6G59_04425 [Actinobacteria bacterium]|nr:MAG: hypothetical protein E6G59_04425 [Actinomycetota bacterium]